jgi:hypothetical protein
MPPLDHPKSLQAAPSCNSVLQIPSHLVPTGVTQQLAIRGGKQCLDDALDTSFRQLGHLHVVTLPAALTITRVVDRQHERPVAVPIRVFAVGRFRKLLLTLFAGPLVCAQPFDRFV